MHPERTGRDALFGPDGTGGAGPTSSQAAGGADVPDPHVEDAGAPVPVPGVPVPAPALAASARPLAVGWNPAADRTAPSAPAGYAGPAGSPTTTASPGPAGRAMPGGSPTVATSIGPAGRNGPAGSPTTAAPTGAGRAAAEFPAAAPSSSPAAPRGPAPARPRPGASAGTATAGSPWRPRIDPEPSILGLSRLSRGALGSRLFTLGFAAIFTLIAVQMVVALLTG